jgi:hypothetical protein
VSGYGNDPANWRVSPTGLSPGRANSGNLPPNVWAGDDRSEFIGHPAALTCAISDDAWPGSVLSAAWEKLSGPAPVTFTGPTAQDTTALFTAAGQYVLRLTANDGTLTASDTVTVNVIDHPFDLWQASVFTPAELSDQTISGHAADPDQDGRVNLTEYLFASAPKLPDSAAVTVEIVNACLQIRWQQRPQTPDLVITAERADRLDGPWFTTPELFDRTETNLGAMTEITVRERLPITTRSQGFLRLRLRSR